MFMACVATIIIVLIMAGIFLRYGRRGYSLSILPLVTVPLFYTISNIMLNPTKTPALYTQVTAATILGAVVISGILLGLCSLIFKSKTTKTYYLVCCALFTLVFAIVLLFNVI